jgi:hypothetical protein
MKVQLINLGRNKVNEIVYPADMKVLQRIINKHVLTTCWDMIPSKNEDNEYHIIRSMDIIGTIKILNK